MLSRLRRLNAAIDAHRRGTALGVFVLALVSRAGYWSVSGTVVNKSSRHFLTFCDALGRGENVVATVLQSPQGGYRLLFTGYWLPMCGPYLALGGSVDAVVAWQLLVSALTCVVVFDLGRRVGGGLAGAVGALFMVGMLDNFAWTTRILADTLFTFLVALAMWQLYRYRKRPTRGRRLALWALLAWLAVTKPQGSVVVLAWVAYDLTPARYGLRYGLVPRRLAALAAVGVAVPTLLFAVPHALEQAVQQWRRGLLVQFDPTVQYDFTPRPAASALEFLLVNLDHVLVMAVLKLGLFYLPVYGRLSPLHNAINAVTLLPVVGFGFAGLYRLARTRRALARDVGTPVLVLTLVVMVTFVDYSWGYRAPVVPPLAVAAGYALTHNRWLDAEPWS